MNELRHSPPIRVLHVVNGLGLGGTEKAMQLYATHLDKARFAAAVYSPTDGERAKPLREAGVATHIGGDLLACLERFKPHIVHLHRAGWTEPRTLATLRRARPVVVIETNVFGRFDPSEAAEEIIDCHLHISRFCLERLRIAHGVDPVPPKYRHLPYPVDSDFFEAAAPPRALRAPVAGRLSRPDPGKWSALAMDFLPLAVREIPDFTYLVIGATQQFRDFVRQNALERAVREHPPVLSDAELARFFCEASLLAHANDTGETFGLAIAEAMAAGLPVITHPAKGLRDNAQLELVDHRKTGFVAETVEDYAAAVVWLLKHPDEAARMGEAGREKIKRLYRAQTVAARLAAIYDDALDAARKAGRIFAP